MRRQTRREFLKTAAAGTAAFSIIGFPRVSRGAGKLTLALWDHWVKPANNVVLEIVNEWGKANKVEVQVDFFPTIGDKLSLTGAAEARAGAGHDIITLWQWDAVAHKDKLTRTMRSIWLSRTAGGLQSLLPSAHPPIHWPPVWISGRSTQASMWWIFFLRM